MSTTFKNRLPLLVLVMAGAVIGWRVWGPLGLFLGVLLAIGAGWFIGMSGLFGAQEGGI